jgi:aminoglycoside/choline kinase family phosphotransferase
VSGAALSQDPRVEAYLEARRGERHAGGEILPLSGDASTRRYFRLRETGRTSILALYPEPAEAATRVFLEIRQLLAGYGLPVPEVLDQDATRGILVLEDLGDVTLQEALRDASDGERLALYRRAVGDLATLQRAAANGSREAACFRIAFDVEKLSWELNHFEEHFVRGLRGCALSVEDRSTLAEAFHRLSTEIAGWPRVLSHRDFHSRNLMRHGGRLVWIDFQDARLGPATYDLVSLLRDAYVDLPEDLVEDQMEEFRQAATPGESRELFRRRFELMSVQRNLKALGTFGYMTAVRGSAVYLPYIPRTLAHVRRNLSRHPELSGLRRVLAHHIEELS